MRRAIRSALFVLATSAFLSPAGVSLAQSLPEPLKPIGNLDSPFNLIIPNYSEAPLPSSWQGFYFKPSIGYESISFGNQLSHAKGMTLGASGGYDFRYDNFVFGPTGDLNYDFVRGSQSSIDGVSGYRTRIDFDGSGGGQGRGLMGADPDLYDWRLCVRQYERKERHTWPQRCSNTIRMDGWWGPGISLERKSQSSLRIQARTVL
nr:hypothetical protein [Bradyrhizobium sp. SZCCHNS2005]